MAKLFKAVFIAFFTIVLLAGNLQAADGADLKIP